MAADPSVKIRRIVLGEFEVVKGRVERSDPWTPEGRRSRERLKAIFGTLRKLARDSEEQLLQDGVEKLIDTVRSNVPNLDGPNGLS